jgi:Cu2+-exporting ATPase
MPPSSDRVPFEQALLAGLAVLVVACPCSLGLAAPLATTLGIGLTAQRGILLRSGDVLEKLTRIRAIAFDKTGTLTEGRPQVLQIAADGATERQVMDYAGALARASEHPLAQPIAAAVGSQAPADAVQAKPGAGLSGNVDGRPVALGSAAFMSAAFMSMPTRFTGKQPPHECTLVYVGWDGRVRGRIALADRLLPEAARLMDTLRRRDMPVLLLSGDREAVVARTATRLGIPVWHSELMPEAKIGALQEAAKRHGPTAMVGDGLNDGPVLAAASVGIAVGGATDLARESADVVLPERALENLPWLLDLAAHVRKSIRANLAWALGYNVIALALAASGVLQPVIAAALMAGSSLLVVARSLSAAHGIVLPAADRAPAARTSPA